MLFLVTFIFILFFLAYSISSSLDNFHNLIGAIIFISGFKLLIPTSNLTWSLPLAVHPCAIIDAFSFSAKSTSIFAIRGLAIAVARVYFFSYLAFAIKDG